LDPTGEKTRLLFSTDAFEKWEMIHMPQPEIVAAT